MTYRELLFRMAEKEMLTLSSDKDGRGLFWAGMNNMEALDKEFEELNISLDQYMQMINLNLNYHILKEC